MKKKTVIHTPKKKAHHAVSVPKPVKPVEKKVEVPKPQPVSEPVPQPVIPEPQPPPSPAQEMHHRIVKS